MNMPYYLSFNARLIIVIRCWKKLIPLLIVTDKQKLKGKKSNLGIFFMISFYHYTSSNIHTCNDSNYVGTLWCIGSCS